MSGKYEYRGISTFIATLLLMVLAVAAGAIIYAYTMGYLGGLGTTKTPGTLSLDSAIAYDGTNKDNITAYVRNIGKGTVILEVAYVDGVQFTDVDGNEEAGEAIACEDDEEHEGCTYNGALTPLSSPRDRHRSPPSH